MNSILNRIAEHKQEEIAQAKRLKPLASLKNIDTLPVRDFIAGLHKINPAIIAEIKKASPSKGIIRADFDVATIAQIYEKMVPAVYLSLQTITFFKAIQVI
ncbi:indole-3-glycerol phosphate synthase [Legionella feeleii]|uniref:indole-3-glycerol-phosphate synthase n=1 Tax=Legionella feeleii TaxID=453 RepID=A0A2X1R7U5_9GAMM|nr:indole-3-glycerol phosphate synthase [Legionella feeleii]